MEINGKIYRILPHEEVSFGDGTKKMKSGFVIVTDGEYPKKVAFELFGEERLLLLNGLNEGTLVKVNFLPVSFEGKEGKYYTTLRCTNVFPLVAEVSRSAHVSVGNPNPAGTPTSSWADDGLPFDNDLPFA